MTAASISLIEPSLDRLLGYMTALEAGWSPTTCDTGNAASCRVIEANSGIAAGERTAPDHPSGRTLLFWIDVGA